MKTIFTLGLVTVLVTSCAQFRPDKLNRAYTNKRHIKEIMKTSYKLGDINTDKNVSSNNEKDTSNVDPYQEAFAVYLGTLSEEERQEVLDGMVYSEDERDSFLKEIEIKSK
ncbi:MAG: hypothetical protein LW688_10150 [Cryomorphaceae bacterium]|jgi:hypothetical protein|nr:hypothetical protein [Cryomorphaceae bacterium]